MPATPLTIDGPTAIEIARSQAAIAVNSGVEMDAAAAMTASASLATAEALTRIADLLEHLLPLAPFVPMLVGAIVEELADGMEPGPEAVERIHRNSEKLADLARSAGFLP